MKSLINKPQIKFNGEKKYLKQLFDKKTGLNHERKKTSVDWVEVVKRSSVAGLNKPQFYNGQEYLYNNIRPFVKGEHKDKVLTINSNCFGIIYLENVKCNFLLVLSSKYFSDQPKIRVLSSTPGIADINHIAKGQVKFKENPQIVSSYREDLRESYRKKAMKA
ncbi:hypothetical protein Glove_456g16 [Diversispora epigaea]|uniref:Uncharacterized protein n=1 Tax=Diversispora epigaea TaxID=1348612 RepID=A0A397GXU7_9GLOM|nr:hypothetical protein Glove_456g16 [Diversispora epigaea]